MVGRQCADFNCFNLHDYKEFFHTGRTRHLHGLHPGKGDFLWSAPPRERPMMAIIADTVGTNDVLYPRCSGYLFEYHYGLPVHTNCHDIQAEAQREADRIILARYAPASALIDASSCTTALTGFFNVQNNPAP